MERQILQVKQFQEAFGVDLPKRPTLLPKNRAAFRQVLLEEEVDEIRRGFESEDIVQVADGIIDSMYILIGTAHEYGFSDRLSILFDEVHRSNMSKMGRDGKAIFREDGKVMKPDTYSPPKLATILQRDFSLYTDNETLKGIAEIEKKHTENKIKKTISSKLKLFDRILFLIYDKIESRLNKRVEVKFPITTNESIVVEVYGEKHKIR